MGLGRFPRCWHLFGEFAMFLHCRRGIPLFIVKSIIDALLVPCLRMYYDCFINTDKISRFNYDMAIIVYKKQYIDVEQRRNRSIQAPDRR